MKSKYKLNELAVNLSDNGRNTEAVRKYLKEFAEILCQEQREICSRQISGWPDKILTESEMEERVFNAPSPIGDLSSKFQNKPDIPALLRRQRELCGEIYLKSDYLNRADCHYDIINAPSPEL